MNEINLTAYQDDGDFGKKFIAEQRKWIAEFEANPEDAQHNCDASDFSGLLGEALTEIERLNIVIDELIKQGNYLEHTLRLAYEHVNGHAFVHGWRDMVNRIQKEREE